MENKNNSSMRKKLSLIDTYKESLNEDLISKAALEGKLIASELEGYLKMMTKDSKISAELTKAGIRTSEELLTALKGNRLTSTLKGSLELSILKSNTKNAKLIDLAAENLVRNKSFDQKYAAEFAKGQPAYEKALKQAGYSEDAITRIVQKKFNLPTPKPIPPKPTPPLPTPPKPLKTWWERWREKIIVFLKNKPNWKQIVAWAAVLGISASAIWWMIHTFASDKKSEDFPPVPPVDTEWAPCIQELLKSKEGVLQKTTNNQISVIVKPTDFPGGVQFYNNGRVMDIAGKKMGTWKCKGTTVKIDEAQKISLNGLLKEQGDATTAIDVETMIDLLDFPVTGGDLVAAGNLLQKYADNGKGKDFLNLYQQSGIGGGDLTKTLNYIVTTEPQSVQAKNRLTQLSTQILSGKNSTSQVTGKKGITGIDITWDNQKKKVEVVKPKYHDCSGKDTFEFLCRAPKIKEIQICLGMEVRFQTGNFGPLTKKALEDMSYDTSQGITVEMYNRIKSTCTGNSDVDNSNVRLPKLDNAGTEPLKINQKPIAPVNIDNVKLPNLQPVSQGNKGEKIYNLLKGNFDTRNEAGKERDSYIFLQGNRMKYKGDGLSQENLNALNGYLSGIGYDFMKEKSKEDYESKYVWLKR